MGYFLLKGKCPECGKKINIRYLIVELITGITFVVNVLVNGFNFVSYKTCYFFK
jgi:prepilin signal peptidase PulO-like enzyme (type II secretory pathway)